MLASSIHNRGDSLNRHFIGNVHSCYYIWQFAGPCQLCCGTSNQAWISEYLDMKVKYCIGETSTILLFGTIESLESLAATVQSSKVKIF